VGAAVLTGGLAWLTGEAARDPRLLYVAAGAAALGGVVTWIGGNRRPWDMLLFLADTAWISLAVLATGRSDSGLTLLFPLVAFAAGLSLGGKRALGISLLAGTALVLTAVSLPDADRPAGWILVQGLLVLVLGGVTDRTRAVMLSGEQALDLASRAVERVRVDSEDVVQNLESALLTVDGEGRVVHVNRTAERVLGIEEDAVRGRPAESVLPEGTGALVAAMMAAVSTGRPARRKEIDLQLRGRTVPVGVGVTVLGEGSGKPTGAVALFQDLTEIRHQERLRRRRDRLAAVGELAAGIAHEIRNSVLPISGSVQILAQEVALTEEQARLFDVIERETENVERFVGDLLNYTRSEQFRPTTVNLLEIVHEVVETTQLSRQEGPAIEVGGGEVATSGDADQLRQAVRNLLLNAADAAGEAGRITVRVGESGEGAAWIEVEDDGIGIQPADRDRVLEPFYTTKPGGTGLGLPIVARIIEDHHGELRLLESKSGGARFRIVLPPAAAAAEAVAAA
jgi:PAS domain S-box-containing protein